MQNYENGNPAAAQEPQKEKHSAVYFIVGVLIFALAVFGAVRLVLLGTGAVKRAAEERRVAQATEYNRFLIPIAAIDMEPFDDITGARMSELVEMSVWSVLNAAKDPTIYAYSDGELQIPAAEVENAYDGFFGSEVPIIHCTVSGYGYEFAYDGVSDVYKIPLTAITPLYTPTVVSVETRGGATVITCGLINTGLYTQDPVTGNLQLPAPDKYLKVTLRGSVIRAVQSSGVPETASVETTVETTVGE